MKTALACLAVLCCGLLLVKETVALNCVQCVNCPYSQVVGMAPTACSSDSMYCTVTEESGLFNRGCAAACQMGNNQAQIDGNAEGLIMCCQKDGCNSASGLVASAGLVLLGAAIFRAL